VSADRQSLDEMLADSARDRDKLLAELLTADEAMRKAAERRTRWSVVRQIHTDGEVVEQPISRHRFERLAYWRAYRLTRSHPAEIGCHYTVRRAGS